jgi:hypothetical protein
MAGVKVGRKIDVGDVLSRSAKILSAHPLLLVPQLILFALTNLGDAFGASSIQSLISILSFVPLVIVSGAYPSMVKAVMQGGQPSVTEALAKAYHKFWSLLLAGILVGVIVVLGFVALIIPGMIFAAWYAYTVPAIMLEDKGATQGMAASKAFGRDKKGSTILIGVVVVVAYLVLFVVKAVFSPASPLLGDIVYAILSVPLGAWVSVILAYAYLAYGPSPVPTIGETAGYGMTPPVSPLPTAQADASVATPGNFCPSCGSAIPTGSKFCASCGRTV